MFLTLSAALVAGNPFAHLGLPRVIGGILGGFPLGPSVLGLIALDFRLWLLHGCSRQDAWLPTSCWPRNCPLLIIAGFGLVVGIAASVKSIPAILRRRGYPVKDDAVLTSGAVYPHPTSQIEAMQGNRASDLQASLWCRR
jgi:hypothetical protein